MDDKTIISLAREYAEEMIRRIHQTVHTPPEILLDIASSEAKFNMEDVIRFLLRRYCIVEKNKVVAEYKNVVKAVTAKREYNLTLSEDKLAKSDLLFDLFPEIAKEVE